MKSDWFPLSYGNVIIRRPGFIIVQIFELAKHDRDNGALAAAIKGEISRYFFVDIIDSFPKFDRRFYRVRNAEISEVIRTTLQNNLSDLRSGIIQMCESYMECLQ